MRVLFILKILILFFLYSSISYSSISIWGVSRPPLSSNENENTYTYIKCVYKKTISSDTEPEFSWVWGLDPKNENKYSIVYGNWFSNNIINNLFFTSATNSEIKDVCLSTLKQKKIKTDIVIPYASNHYLSYYYSFWNDSGNNPRNDKKNINLDRIVVFGDSLSDTINIYNAFYGAMPNHNSWFLGRFSNGKVWHEYLSDLVSLPSYAWAVGNSESGEKKFFPGLKKQLQSFIKYSSYAANYKISNTIFAVLFGGNDLISGDKNPLDIIINYKEELPKLAELGAKYIIVINLPDLTITPEVNDWTLDKKNKLKEDISLVNKEINSMISDLRLKYQNTKWIVFDLHSNFDNLLINKTKSSCLNINHSRFSYFKKQEVNINCKLDYANYVFWDNIHPITDIHNKIAGFIFDKLKNELVIN